MRKINVKAATMTGQPDDLSTVSEPAAPGKAQLCLLGSFRITGPGGQTIAVPTKKNRALLAALALAPSGHLGREKLAALLWGDRGDEQARSSLRQSLAVLRRELGDVASAVWTRDDQIGLDPGIITVDVLRFLALAQRTERESLATAAELYQGELLPDPSIREEAFEDWLSGERRRLAERAAGVFESLAADGIASQRITYARRLVELDPLREASHRILMLAYSSAGENGLALRQYDTCRALMRSELGVEPGAQTQDLRRQLAASGGPALSDPNVRALQSPSSTDAKLPIAVLPFANLSGDAQQQYFADGISEDIITGLARFRHLSVTARNTSFRYRGDIDVRAAGEELGVRYIVEGSMRRIGPRLRITTQLIEAFTAKHLWAESYDVPEAEIFDVQDKVVQTIVATLGGRITDASVHHARLKQPGSLAAYELVLQANAMNWETREAKAEVRRMLEAALLLDPLYATAHSLLAAVTLRDASYHAQLTRPVLDIVLTHARRAVDIDENDSACHSILGWALLASGDFDLADVHISRALQLNPNNAFGMVNRGSLLMQSGSPDDAIMWFERVQASDPYFNPSWCREKLGFAHFTARRYAEAISHLQRASKLRFYMQAVLAACHAKLGNQVEAAAALLRVLAQRPDCTNDTIVPLVPYARAADRQHLEEALAEAGIPVSADCSRAFTPP